MHNIPLIFGTGNDQNKEKRINKNVKMDRVSLFNKIVDKLLEKHLFLHKQSNALTYFKMLYESYFKQNEDFKQYHSITDKDPFDKYIAYLKMKSLLLALREFKIDKMHDGEIFVIPNNSWTNKIMDKIESQIPSILIEIDDIETKLANYLATL